jgi:transcriptional regulator with XRE-family HTH domain
MKSEKSVTVKSRTKGVFKGDVLKDLRLKKDLSVYALHQLSGVGQAQIYRMEKGEYARPCFEVVASLAHCLGVSTDVFVNQMAL